MRKFIRHPSTIPINFHIKDVVANEHDYLRDISVGGLCFKSHQQIDPGAVIVVEIPIQEPEISLEGQVVWCKSDSSEEKFFNVGVEFKDAATDFKVRMVEQVCYIEEYRENVRVTEGRILTGEEAAMEWIRKYSKDFPSLQ